MKKKMDIEMKENVEVMAAMEPAISVDVMEISRLKVGKRGGGR